MRFLINIFVGFLILSAPILPTSLDASFYYVGEEDLHSNLKGLIPQGEKKVILVLDGDIIFSIVGDSYNEVMNSGWDSGDQIYVKFIKKEHPWRYTLIYTYEITNLNKNSTVIFVFTDQGWQ